MPASRAGRIVAEVISLTGAVVADLIARENRSHQPETAVMADFIAA